MQQINERLVLDEIANSLKSNKEIHVFRKEGLNNIIDNYGFPMVTDFYVSPKVESFKPTELNSLLNFDKDMQIYEITKARLMRRGRERFLYFGHIEFVDCPAYERTESKKELVIRDPKLLEDCAEHALYSQFCRRKNKDSEGNLRIVFEDGTINTKQVLRMVRIGIYPNRRTANLAHNSRLNPVNFMRIE
jgi:hypothetical protein